MRVSVQKSDCGYVDNNWEYEVYLDNELQTHAITADEEEGYILRYKKDEDGELIINKVEDDFETEIVHGKVTVLNSRG